MVLRAGIGQTGPFLFKLPQLLSQLFHHLVRTLLSLGSRVVWLQRHLLAGQAPLEHELPAIGTKNERSQEPSCLFSFVCNLKNWTLEKKHVTEKTV
jgi:hypothetical protein